MMRLLEELWRDVRYTTRMLRRTPGLTFTALATLALCLGANVTIFAVVDSILLRPLPFPAADRLVRVFNMYPKAGVMDDGSSITNYYERRGRIAAFSSLAQFRNGTVIVGESGSTQREWMTRITPDFFTTLGVGPVMGRAFGEEDMTPRMDRVVIVTDAYWRQQLQADSGVLGRSIRVDGVSHTVVGVLPPTFRVLSSNARLYLPFSSSPQERTPQGRHGGNSLTMIARLRPESTMAEAQAQVDAHNAVVEANGPEAAMMREAGFRTLVVPLRADHVASIKPALLLVQGGALFLLLIGAVNLGNLLLIRATGRAKELAIRQAIGASQARVASEVLVETTMLVLLGGLLGVAAGAVGVRLLSVFGADQLPLGASIAFDVRVAAAAFGGTLMVGVLTALPIAWFSVRQQLGHALQLESRSATTNRMAQRLRQGFVVAQVTLAFVLLFGTGLLAISLANAMAVAPGFRADHVLKGRVSLPAKGYPSAESLLAFTERVADDIARQPGVRAVGVATNMPLSGITIKSATTVKGYTRPPGESLQGHYSYGVNGDYFAAMGLVVKEGRSLTATDSRSTARVCVVDEDFARRYWHGRSALGEHVFQGGEPGTDADAFTIVGVVGAAKQAEMTEDAAQGAVYYPFTYQMSRDPFIVTRTTSSPEALAMTLRRVVNQIDADMPVNDVESMHARVADSLVG